MVESSVAERLQADVSSTERMDRQMAGIVDALTTEDLRSSTASQTLEPCPPHIQVRFWWTSHRIKQTVFSSQRYFMQLKHL